MSANKCPHIDSCGRYLHAYYKEARNHAKCVVCDRWGRNFWQCVECGEFLCSEEVEDHSTEHFRENPSHAVQKNLTSQRLWCYLCESEVFHGQPPVSGESSGKEMKEEEFDYLTMSNNRKQYGGLVGLRNLANTCYMNAALQALSNCPPLTGYFLDCGSIVETTLNRPSTQQRKSDLAKGYYRLVKEMWCRTRRSNGSVVPREILHGIRITHPMFRGYQQHDTQEFLRCFMDQLHEELKEVTPPPPRYIDLKLYRRIRFNLDGDDQDRDSNCSSPAPSEAEYETCDSGVSEQSQLSDLEDEPVSPSLPRRKFSRSASPTMSAGSRSAKVVKSRSTTSTASSNSGSAAANDPPKSHRSIISDVFDGKLLSSVQCLTCDRLSTREETFQDLSLPIPGKDHLAVLHQSQSNQNLPSLGITSQGQSNESLYQPSQQDGWFWWFWQWMRSWFYGPPVTLHDCLAAFFSADELKNDNMYSCEKCKKLRNGIKYSRVLALPEMLCVHLKRFRHDLSYSSKISSAVHFPLTGLDMRPYLHKDCRSEVSTYDLTAVICHHGTVGGGHYTCYAKHEPTGNWFEYDDQLVTKVQPETVLNCEPYVLFYRKTNPQMEALRARAMELVDKGPPVASDIRFFVSKSWFNRFNTFAEPGPIDNWALLCPHGGLPPCKAGNIKQLVMPLPQPLWEFLYETFGGGPACNQLFECVVCKSAVESLTRRQRAELEMFTELNCRFQIKTYYCAIYAISMSWFRQWQLFARGLTMEPPGPLNNKNIVSPGCDTTPIRNVRQGSDYAQIDGNLWRFFFEIYGGGPEILLKEMPEMPEREVVDQELRERFRRSDWEDDNGDLKGYVPYQGSQGGGEESDEMEVGEAVQNGHTRGGEEAGEGQKETLDQSRTNEEMMESFQREDNGKEDEATQNSDTESEVATVAMDSLTGGEDALVGDQPTVFGLANKQDFSVDGENQDEINGHGDGMSTMTVDSGIGGSLTNGSVASSEGSEKRKAKGGIVDPSAKHRMIQTSGMFGAAGTFVMHSPEEVERNVESSAPVVMEHNGEAGRLNGVPENAKKPRSNHHGKGKHWRKGRRN